MTPAGFAFTDATELSTDDEEVACAARFPLGDVTR